MNNEQLPIREGPISFETLKPTEWSVLWLQEQGKIEQAERIEKEAEQTLDSLKDFNRSFRSGFLTQCSDLASRSVSYELHEAVQVRRFFAIPNILPGNNKELQKAEEAEIDLFRNLSVLHRNNAQRLKEAGQAKESEEELFRANHFFDIYEFRSAKQVPDVRDEQELMRYGTKAVKERESGTTKLDTAFDPRIIKAVEDVNIAFKAILDGNMNIEGVDRRWLSVLYHVNPNRQRFPQAYDAMRKIEQHYANQYGINVDDMTTYMMFSENEMFPYKPDNND